MNTTTSTLILSLSLLVSILSLSGCVSEESDSGSPRSTASAVKSGPQDVNYCIYARQGKIDREYACLRDDFYSEEYAQDAEFKMAFDAEVKANKEAAQKSCNEVGMCWNQYMTYSREAAETCDKQVKDMSCARVFTGPYPTVCGDVCTFEEDRIRSGAIFHEVGIEIECRKAEVCLDDSEREARGYGSTKDECIYSRTADVEKEDLATQCEDAGLKFDSEASAECLTALEAQSCDTFNAGTLPEACKRTCK